MLVMPLVRGEIYGVYGVRYTWRDFTAAELPEGYFAPRSRAAKIGNQVGTVPTLISRKKLVVCRFWRF